MIAETTRLRIEVLTADHAPLLAEAIIDPAVYAFFPDDQPKDLAELTKRFGYMATGPHRPGSTQIWLNYALLDRQTGEGVGFLEATIEGTSADIAYLLGKQWWGQGLTSEALAWYCSYLKTAHGITEIWATVTSGNDASARVAQKAGFVEAALPEGGLSSYDPGDWVFRREV